MSFLLFFLFFFSFLILTCKNSVILNERSGLEKFYFQESELTALLRRMEIGSNELKILREHAQNFLETIDSFIASAEPHALPICLAHYLFDQLSNTQSCDKNKRLLFAYICLSDICICFFFFLYFCFFSKNLFFIFIIRK